jgi:3-deoxy-D-manno-octulosonic-acid transferase
MLTIKRNYILYSESSPANITNKQVLIIDNIGMLSSLYRYAKLAYIGGGFGKGIHNLLEAAAFGIPTIFGPNHNKFREAKELEACGGAVSIHNYNELEETLYHLVNHPEALRHSSIQAKNYIHRNTGATSLIARHIIPNRLPSIV